MSNQTNVQRGLALMRETAKLVNKGRKSSVRFYVAKVLKEHKAKKGK